MDEIEFLGKGWAFPPRFSRNGGAEIVSGTEDIEQSIDIILHTRPGERPLNIDFGCRVKELIFLPQNETLKQKIEDEIRMALLRFEPRIIVEEITFREYYEKGVIEVHIEYLVISTNTRANKVFPFFLQEGTNIDL